MPLSRRQFVARSAAAAATLPFWSVAQATPRRSDFEVLRRGVGMYTNRGGTIGYLDTPAARVAVDAQFPEAAQAFLDGLSAPSLDLLVNTHHHGDHTAGNAVLGPAAARHVAHEAVSGLQRAASVRGGSLDGQVYASELYADTWSADVGDETVTLRYFGPAHTAGDSVVHFERADIVHMGDLVFNRRQPYVDRPAGVTIRGWIDVLEATHDTFTDETIFVFGHAGEGHAVRGTRADLLAMRDFLGELYGAIGKALAFEVEPASMDGHVLDGFTEWGPIPMRTVEAVVAEHQTNR